MVIRVLPPVAQPIAQTKWTRPTQRIELLRFPDEMLCHILSFVDFLGLFRCARVCSRLNIYASDNNTRYAALILHEKSFAEAEKAGGMPLQAHLLEMKRKKVYRLYHQAYLRSGLNYCRVGDFFSLKRWLAHGGSISTSAFMHTETEPSFPLLDATKARHTNCVRLLLESIKGKPIIPKTPEGYFLLRVPAGSVSSFDSAIIFAMTEGYSDGLDVIVKHFGLPSMLRFCFLVFEESYLTRFGWEVMGPECASMDIPSKSTPKYQIASPTQQQAVINLKESLSFLLKGISSQQEVADAFLNQPGTHKQQLFSLCAQIRSDLRFYPSLDWNY